MFPIPLHLTHQMLPEKEPFDVKPLEPFLRGLLNLFPLRNRRPGFSRSKQTQLSESVPRQPGGQTRDRPVAPSLSARWTKSPPC